MINKKRAKQDLTDSPEDQEKLKPDEALFDLPEIKDIPGARRSGKNDSELPEIQPFPPLTKKRTNFWRTAMAWKKQMSARLKKNC
jgi:hypothetical protein